MFPTYTKRPARARRTAHTHFDFISPPHLFELSGREGSSAALSAGCERRAATPPRARAPCRAPPARGAVLPRRARLRPRRGPRTRSRNEAPCPRFPRGEVSTATLNRGQIQAEERLEGCCC